jgi:murein DD-endopeptidase MepM/ murein hydrolase activator NlpD
MTRLPQTGLIKAYITAKLLRFGLVGMVMLIAACQAPNLTMNRETKAPVLTAPLRHLAEPLPPNGIIEVRANDTIYSIATRYDVPPLSIVETNGLAPPYDMRQGQILKVIPRRTHRVGPDDSVYSISQRYAVSQYQLAQLNDLAPPFELKVGQRLLLPGTLDFSVLDTGLPAGVSSTGASQPKPTAIAAAKPTIPRKKFIAPAAGANGFRWPVEGEVIAEFGPSARGVHNDGINIAAANGTTVTAAAKGRVAFVGDNIKSFGKLILVKHDGGIITAYAHLGGIAVKEGDIVAAGQAIGAVGMTGRVDTPQLHFEIRKSRQPLDPRRFMS